MVAMVEEIRPPMTVMAKGWKILEPTAGFTATGIRVKMVVKAAIRIGRRRTETAARSDVEVIAAQGFRTKSHLI